MSSSLGSRPLVSIVIPTFNRAGGLLEQAIESVLSQEYPDLELTVIDDGSTDRTPEVLADLARRHPKRLQAVRQENVGMLGTINRGFEMARGELVGFVMSDDLLLPGAIEAFVEALEADPGAAAVFCAWHAVDDEGRILDTITPLEFSRRDAVRLAYNNVGAGSLVRRAVLERTGLLDRAFRNMWDFDFWFRVAAEGRAVRLAQPLSCFRVHAGQAGTTERGVALAKERIALFDKIYASGELEEEIAEVREEAFRNTLIGAALVARVNLNNASDRYFIEDRLYRRIARRAGEFDFDADIEDGSVELHLRRCEIELEHLGRVVAERELALAESRVQAEKGRSEP
jgi:glycosyltransferase involved in cell wall biosynthesis